MNAATQGITPGGFAGKVYLVGAGPGDGGLITVKGAECLKKADVVVYDYLSDPCLLAYAPASAEIIYVGKEASRHTLEQHEINALLVEKTRGGRTVVRLKGGDPFVFGRGGEECETLVEAAIPFEIVPGVTSGIAGPAYAGIPVTHRKVASSVAFVTGNEDPTKASTNIHWEHLARGVDTLVFYMGVGNLPAIVHELKKYGRPPSTPVAVIRWGTKTNQRTVTGTLDTIVAVVNDAQIKPPAITIVGEVVGLRDRLSWFENRPLSGKRIVTTRTREQASVLSSQLSELGAEVIELPTITIVPAVEGGLLDGQIAEVNAFDWIIFTSPNGATIFFDRLLKANGDVRALGKARIASIGPGTTAAIERYHVSADITAEDSVAEGLLRSLQSVPDWDNKKVLLPRAENARDILPETLRSWGASVTVAAAYRTVQPDTADRAVLEDILEKRYDLVTFSSSSTFENFIALFSEEEKDRIKQSLQAASIGPVTTATIKKHGMAPAVEAQQHTIAGLVAAIKEYLTK